MSNINLQTPLIDLIRDYLAVNPVPELYSAFSSVKHLNKYRDQVKIDKEQLLILSGRLAGLLKILNGEYQSGRLLQAQTSSALKDLNKLSTQVAHLIEMATSEHFLEVLFAKDLRQSQIREFHRRIDSLAISFQITTLLDITSVQVQNEEAQVQDKLILDQRLEGIENNYAELRSMLQALMDQQNAAAALIASLDKRSQIATSSGERRFFSHAFQYLSTISGEQVELESWTITRFDVEFGVEIGSGGFGQVFKGTWGKTEVALKVLKIENGCAPSSNTICREVTIWLKLSHPNVLQFLGANVLDGRPFIVMPYHRHGNARDFISGNPECDRLQILYDMSLGLLYLHSRNVIHGDLKGANVLIDNSGKALLCDFGLSLVKADATSRTAKQGDAAMTGSRNWMAPELLMGGSQRKSCDVYSFGITIFEIYMNETPFSNVGYGDFLELVGRNHIRPQRPDDGEVPELSDEVWDLAERCWTHIAKKRPITSQVCDDIAHLLHTRQTLTRPTISRSSPESKTTTGSSKWLPSPLNLTAFTNTAFTNIFTASYSPDGKYIAAGTSSTIMVLDAQTGVSIWGPLSDMMQPAAVAFSPDGKRVAFCSENIVIRDVLTGQLVVGPIKTYWIISVSFSPDGKQLATSNGKGNIEIWDAYTGNLILGPRGSSMYVCPVACSGDGKYVVSGSNGDLPMSLWDMKSGRLIRSFTANLAANFFVAFSPDGKRIISSSYEGNSCVWDLDSGALISGPSKRHPEGTLAVLFTPASNGIRSSVSVVSPDGKWIMTATLQSKTFEIWNSKTGLLATTFTESGSIQMISFSPDSKRILVLVWFTFRIYHLDC
ncbi:hypothetical protein APHAL10511_005260 [Amanita phalloides]|nr:hypothetical protein APHAL10511_005260 [Amanita phalloides]